MTRDVALQTMLDVKHKLVKDEQGKLKYIPPKPDVFFLAETTEPVEMHVWNGVHPVEENTKVHTAPAGTTVLVTVYSRFGDVGIRDDNLDPPSHGYYARVNPDTLNNWRIAK